MTPALRIRPAIVDDRAAIAAIHVESWRDAYRGLLSDAYLAAPVAADLSAKWRDARFDDRDVHLIAETPEGPAGFVAVLRQPGAPAYVDNLHARPALRGRGIGAALMRAAAEELIARGDRAAWLWVFRANAGAIRFYERLGARRDREEDREFFGQPAPSLRMVWDDLAGFGA